MNHKTLKKYPRLRLVVEHSEIAIRNTIHRFFPKLIRGRCPDCGEFLFETSYEWVCQNCCPHEFDPNEGFMCLNCNAEGYDHFADMGDYLEDR